MKKNWCICFILLMVTCPVFAYNGPDFGFSGGINRTSNASWSESSLFSMNKYIKYKINNADFTRIEGSICENKIGLRLGVNMEIDNNKLSEVKNVMGYLGLKNTYLRYQTGKLDGAVEWNAALASDQEKTLNYENDLTHVEMLYWFDRKSQDVPFYFGLGYTSISFPTEIRTLVTDSGIVEQKYGKPFLDPDLKGQYYAILFGMDTFASAMIYSDTIPKNQETKSGFGIFFTAEDRFGFGSDTLSDVGLKRAREFNPDNEPVGESFFSIFFENNSSMGLRWRNTTGKVRAIIGIGYELDFFFRDATVAAKQKGDLGFQTHTALIRTGPVFRMHIKW